MTDDIAELRRKITDYRKLARQTNDAQARAAIESLIGEYGHTVNELEKTRQPTSKDPQPPKA